MRTHTGERPYVCLYCERDFAQSGSREAHERTHTGDQFLCSYCDKAPGNWVQAHRRHERWHQGWPYGTPRLGTNVLDHLGPLTFPCTFCAEPFATNELKVAIKQLTYHGHHDLPNPNRLPMRRPTSS